MSLSALLNNDDQDIVPQILSSQEKQIEDINNNNTKNSDETMTVIAPNVKIDPKQQFLDELNEQFTKIQERDIIELEYQDWKFLNFQEFELISEWNYQSKVDWNIHDTYNNFSFKQLYDLISENKIEWKDYMNYKNSRAQMIKDVVDKVKITKQNIRRTQINNKRSKLSNGSTPTTTTLNGNRKVRRFIASTPVKILPANGKDGRIIKVETFKNDRISDGVNNVDSSMIVSGTDGEDEDRYSHINDSSIIDQNEEDEDEDAEGDDENEDILHSRLMEQINEDNGETSDKDFDPDANKKNVKSEHRSSNNKIITLDSDRSKIVRELTRMCNKNKIPRVKKRRFTNALVVEYKPAKKILEVKITLKQYHSKRLKRLVNETKRLREKEAEMKRKAADMKARALAKQADGNNGQGRKRRKLNDSSVKGENDDEESGIEGSTDKPPVVDHGLPTYGMTMSAKEARAIQRHYDNTYITIWKDLARKDSNKMVRMLQQMQSIKATNFKKTSSLCAREARKWQSRNFKQLKDFQTRARRGIREMSNFWKKNERDEREIKKKQEKIALEQAKKEEDARESKRQAKKLNFLLTQTELYSHFIGRKIKTDEYEGKENGGESTNDVDLEQTDSSKKNDFHEIDFDNENDEDLRLKAAENASNVLAETRAKAKQFDTQSHADEEDEDELNFQNPTSLGEITIEQPNLLSCTLKEYQLKGLNWLANLYDQGINGILADEMGLGKTVQSISVLAHLAERYNIWGPFLVVTPASTLHNWVNEIAKFVPDFKILPYWGNANDRKILRKFWDRKNVRYGKDAPFHVMITSYQMVVSDVSYLQKMKWQYMILDEAQAIKSSQSSRWKNLLSFHCRNRLLLTGTPIQNNMQELWALLHFIMPSLFDSHDEFSEWFAKDIESHAESNTQLNQQQLRRLHMILKPFMLRRIKKNVQSELGDKIEIDVLCDLTQRQAKLYNVLRSQFSGGYDAIENAAGNDEFKGDQNLINTVMQFRKVCNHPDLFERADIESPFSFVTFGKSSSMLKFGGNNGTNTITNSVNNSSANIAGINTETNATPLGSINANNYTNWVDLNYSSRNPIAYNLPRLVYEDIILPNYQNNVGSMKKLHECTFNVLNPTQNRELCEFLERLTGCSMNELTFSSNTDILKQAINLNFNNIERTKDNFISSLLLNSNTERLVALSNRTTGGILDSLMNVRENLYFREYMNTFHRAYHPAVASPPVNIRVLGSSNFTNRIERELFDPVVSQALSDIPTTTQYNMLIHKHIPVHKFPKTNMYPKALNSTFSSNISMPSMDRFITESAKLKKLDQLLVKLKEEGHRVLVYFQMTKMMDLMEEYLTYRQYTHIRLDGSSKLEDRRDLVHDWQTKPEIFVFLLSTRAGGLGINLTAADTVIFYDSDWNPTIDSQAMDRAHRLGQTRQVTVYRLLVKDTIEERMRDRAKQKEQVQQVVMEGKTQEHNVKTIEASDKVVT
ncbi:similar to Saccharomyces cerevisiae YGL150C INO80 ATPase and nucleosome spacing factor [Maudiozyma saulgeensis]|uniref:Chromatin-remodeling ATPase INO80 n=1 Tax=Maudiozyma saulgeensis TaxID=1789683 RepID=A0A1X7R171_9SACH|nr:similar to Saccharomyces cerevisiae YGL150C INO80 ATPase and nucleosome spacing factor [Kazachstania saulgeensis]